MLDLESITWLSWWGEADLIVKSVFITLVTLSFISWTLIIYKYLQYGRLNKWEKKLTGLLEHNQLADNEKTLPPAASQKLITDLSRYKPSQAENQYRDLLSRTRLELENYLTVLATIGNSAPFIGLLGTVWGIMHALQKMDGAAGISLDMVAGPVGEALVATAMGLFAAIPAVIGYNLLLRKMRKLLALMELNVKELLRLGYHQSSIGETA